MSFRINLKGLEDMLKGEPVTIPDLHSSGLSVNAYFDDDALEYLKKKLQPDIDSIETVTLPDDSQCPLQPDGFTHEWKGRDPSMKCIKCGKIEHPGRDTSLMISQINRNLQKIYSWHDQELEFRQELLELLVDYLDHKSIEYLRKKFL